MNQQHDTASERVRREATPQTSSYKSFASNENSTDSIIKLSGMVTNG